VAATRGNKNVLISHARWVKQHLRGDEQVLIFEYGEAKPGDIKKMADFSRPDYVIITGLAPAHLEDYGTLDALAQDFGTIFQYADESNVYLNGESPELAARVRQGIFYTGQKVGDWTVRLIKEGLEGLDFEMKTDGRKLTLHSGLVGSHQVGPLAAAVAVAERLGLSDEQIIAGVASTAPFKHRMQPYKLAGAWIIDDTYNGNLEGMKAGLNLLSKLDGKQKTYVTPGLVEQGTLKESVHKELGVAIAQAAPDKTVLMQNSATKFIVKGLEQAGYKGELKIELDPLEFYTNLDHMVAAGDVVLMQNDWTDNYR
jgi:UDP-N-acetylmuramoyl-tripeptide--D-alanyl-D-alanine ligase